jgi:hypothetical protein
MIVRMVAGLFFLLVLLPVSLAPYWVIFKKAGFSPWLTLLMWIPVISLVVLYFVAFSQWRGTFAADRVQTNFPPQA